MSSKVLTVHTEQKPNHPRMAIVTEDHAFLLRQERKKRNLFQADFINKGIAINTISKIERARNVSPKSLTQYAEMLGFTPVYYKSKKKRISRESSKLIEIETTKKYRGRICVLITAEITARLLKARGNQQKRCSDFSTVSGASVSEIERGHSVSLKNFTKYTDELGFKIFVSKLTETNRHKKIKITHYKNPDTEIKKPNPPKAQTLPSIPSSSFL